MIDTTSWDTTPDMFGNGAHNHTPTIQNDIPSNSIDDEINSPEQLLAYAELVQSNDDRRIHHRLFQNTSNVAQDLYFDFSKVYLFLYRHKTF